MKTASFTQTSVAPSAGPDVIIAQFGSFLAGSAFKYIGIVVNTTSRYYGVLLISGFLLIVGGVIIGSAVYFFKVMFYNNINIIYLF